MSHAGTVILGAAMVGGLHWIVSGNGPLLELIRCLVLLRAAIAAARVWWWSGWRGVRAQWSTLHRKAKFEI